MIYFGKTMTCVRSSVNTRKGKSHRSPNKVIHGVSLVKGKSNNHKEDYHAAELKKIKGHELGMFTTFDGYLVDNVPSYLQKNFFQNFLSEEESWLHPKMEIIKAYEKTDKAILMEAPNLGRDSSIAMTTILIDGRKLLVENVGDSRAVLSKNGKSSQPSIDHEPGTSAKRGSIENKGIFVSNMLGYVCRVDRQLVVPQEFGNKSLKSLLWSDPDVREVDRYLHSFDHHFTKCSKHSQISMFSCFLDLV